MEDDSKEKRGEMLTLPRNPGPYPRCSAALRRSTRSEVRADLEDDRTRHIALQVAHGRLDWSPPEELGGDKLSDIYEGGTWLFRCDACGNRTLVSPAVESD
jgi:hypothetical protein